MKIPKKINIGDKIGVISTARKISFIELKPAITILESWGLEVILGDFLFEEYNQFAGTKEQRTIDLQNMIEDDSIKAILCARGGYGTVQIIDNIDFSYLFKNPKWIIGYSDITVLHSHLNKIGLASLHSSMPINFSENSEKSLQSIQNVIFGIEERICIKIKFNKFNKLGTTQANIVGGNLSILYSLLGSESDLNTDGKILFIEDLDEYLYHIDRMIINMKRNMKFERLKGMIIGAMSNMQDNDIAFGKTAYEIILSHISEYNFPVCFGFPAGHLKDNRAIKLGCPSFFEVNENDVILLQ